MTYVRLLLMCGLLGAALGTNAGEREDAAQAAALTWLKLVDRGDYGASWNAAATLFKSQVSARQWAAAASNARRPFGALRSRRLKSATYTTTLPGAPDGHYVVLQFDAAYERKAKAVETVTPLLEAGRWRVSGYYIR